MTMRHPEGMTVSRWLFKDFSFKTVVVTTIAVCGFLYAMRDQVSVNAATTSANFKAVDERNDAQDKRLDAQRDIMSTKVDLPTYLADRALLAQQLDRIENSLNTIQGAMMQPHN